MGMVAVVVLMVMMEMFAMDMNMMHRDGNVGDVEDDEVDFNVDGSNGNDGKDCDDGGEAVLVMSRTCYLRAAIRLVILLKPVIFRLQTVEILLVKAWSRMRMLKM